MKKHWIKRINLIILALLIVGLITWLIVGSQGSPVVFTIQGKDYRTSYVAPLTQFPINSLRIDESTEYKSIYATEQYLTVANNLGITPTAEEINAQQVQLNSYYHDFVKLKSYKVWSALQAKENATTDLVQNEYVDGDYQGYSFIFWYGNLLTTGVTYTPPNYGNQTLIAQDKQYALEKADYYYKQLKSHKMTPTQILSAVLKDPKIAIDYTVTPPGSTDYNNFSVHFGTNPSIPWEQQVFYNSVINWIVSQKKPTISSIMTGQTELDPTTKQFGNTYYYFVELDKVSFSPEQFNQDLLSLSSHYYGVST